MLFVSFLLLSWLNVISWYFLLLHYFLNHPLLLLQIGRKYLHETLFMLMQKLATILWDRLKMMAFLFWWGFDFEGKFVCYCCQLISTVRCSVPQPAKQEISIYTIHPLIAPWCYIHPQMVYSLNASWQGAVSRSSQSQIQIFHQKKNWKPKVEASFAVGSCGLVLCDININRRESPCSWIRISTWLDTLVNFVVTTWHVSVCCT